MLSKLRWVFSILLPTRVIACRGLRGATVVGSNTKESIVEATVELLTALVEDNQVTISNVVAIFFTTTSDLNAEFPALAARGTLGWTSVPLMCGHEMNVPGSMENVIRIMMLINTDKGQADINHVYLRGAGNLRSDCD